MNLSIPDQLRQMREWCATNGHSVAKGYVEPRFPFKFVAEKY